MSFKIMGRRTNPKGVTGKWGVMNINHTILYRTHEEAEVVAKEVYEFKKPGFIYDEDIELKVVNV